MSVRPRTDTSLPMLRACLLHARSRARLRSVLRGAVWSLLLGLIVLCCLEATTPYLEGLPAARWLPALSGTPLLTHLALSAVAFAVAFAIAVLLTLLLAPDLAALARAAEGRFALQERLSTALEVAAALRADAASDPVRAALLADAENHAGAIDPRRLVRLTLPRATWAVPVLVVAAILLQVVPPNAFGHGVPGATTARHAADDGALSRQQAVDTAANLRRIAEILDQDAAQRSDPYLRTIARTLERLSGEVSSMDRRQLASELNRLLSHTQRAYAQGDPASRGAAQRAPTELLREALEDLTGNRQIGAASSRDGDPASPEPAPIERNPTGRPAQPQDRNRAAGGPTQSDQMAALRRLLPGTDIQWLVLDEDGNEVDARAQIERLIAEEERRARGAQSAGAAANAGAGEGDRAGDGVQPLGRGNTAKSADLAAIEQMLLPDPERRDGGRIRIDMPPDAALTDVTAPTADASGGWRRVQEQPVERPALAAEGRRVVGRYFKRSADGRGADARGSQGRSP